MRFPLILFTLRSLPMNSRPRFFIPLISLAALFVLLGASASRTHAETTELRIKVGRGRKTIGTLVAHPPIHLGEALAASGGIIDNPYILLVRHGVLYVLDDAATRAGAWDLPLRNGDEVSTSESGDTLKSLKEQYPQIIVGLPAYQKLAAMEGVASPTPKPPSPAEPSKPLPGKSQTKG